MLQNDIWLEHKCAGSLFLLIIQTSSDSSKCMFCFVNVWNIDIFLCYLIIIKLISILLQIGTMLFILYLLNPLNYWGGLLLISTVSQNLQCVGPLPQENSDL